MISPIEYYVDGIKCPHCGMIYTVPVNAPEELEYFYFCERCQDEITIPKDRVSRHKVKMIYEDVHLSTQTAIKEVEE